MVFSNRRNVKSSMFGWRSSAGKPWTGDTEAPVAEPSVRPRYDTLCRRQPTVAYEATTTGVDGHPSEMAPSAYGETCRLARLIWTRRAVELVKLTDHTLFQPSSYQVVQTREIKSRHQRVPAGTVYLCGSAIFVKTRRTENAIRSCRCE